MKERKKQLCRHERIEDDCRHAFFSFISSCRASINLSFTVRSQRKDIWIKNEEKERENHFWSVFFFVDPPMIGKVVKSDHAIIIFFLFFTIVPTMFSLREDDRKKKEKMNRGHALNVHRWCGLWRLTDLFLLIMHYHFIKKWHDQKEKEDRGWAYVINPWAVNDLGCNRLHLPTQ